MADHIEIVDIPYGVGLSSMTTLVNTGHGTKRNKCFKSVNQFNNWSKLTVGCSRVKLGLKLQ